MKILNLPKTVKFVGLYILFLFIPLLLSGLIFRYLWLLFPFVNLSFLNNVNPNLLLFILDILPTLSVFGLICLGLLLRRSFTVSEVTYSFVSALVTVLLIGAIPLFASPLPRVQAINGRTGIQPRYSIVRGTELLRCGFVSKSNVVDWSFPRDGASDFPTQSPIIVRFKNNVTRIESCSVYDSTRQSYSGSEHQMLGGLANTNYSILPPGALGIVELKHLQTLSEDEAKRYTSNGSWKENTNYDVTCIFYVSNCEKSMTLSFKTSQNNPMKSPTIQREIPSIQLDQKLLSPGVYPSTMELNYPTPGMYPGEVRLDTNTSGNFPSIELKLEENKILETPIDVQE